MKPGLFHNLFWTSKAAIISFLAFVIGILINVYRLELLGVVPGNAGSNFSFNIGFFIPYNGAILISCLVIVFSAVFKWNNVPTVKNRLLSFGLTIPIILFWMLQLARILGD